MRRKSASSEGEGSVVLGRGGRGSKSNSGGHKSSSMSSTPPVPSQFSLLRQHLLERVAQGTPFILRLQRLRRQWPVHLWLRGSSALGDQWSYMIILPLCFWTGDVYLGIEFTLCLLLGTFLGNFAKNIFALPRPPSPPVQLLQHTMNDFGFPSVHTLNAVTVSAVLLRYQWDRCWTCFSSDPLMSQLAFGVSVLLALFWMFSIPLSRMYVGVHSPLDCVAGFGAGVVFALNWMWIYPHLYLWLTVTKTALVPVVIAATFLAITIHPRAQKRSPSYRNNIAVIGVLAGAFIGIPQHPFTMTLVLESSYWGWPQVPVSALANSLGVSKSVIVSVGRFVEGFACVGLIKATMEPLLTGLLTLIFITPIFSTVKYWIICTLSWLTIPHPEALNNSDHPLEGFEADIQEYQNELELELANSKRLARREAAVLARVVAHFLIGISIVDWVRVLFVVTNLQYN